ncbi:MAG: HAMP domain-containing histidine kinase [Ruminococcus sp.]|nr:HAMP domain-containing histidine kinase [Ruminococcus sp.]MCM1380530.1 HAMP domain-containing histidine kinase [Muribaculaceae bacterium]MCM1480160.1 HAMP domain-containing histidine kinase [Muribaculaceae bacterium]
MRKSIFTEFFYLCAAVLFSAVVCVSVVILLVSGEYYKNDKRRFLDGLMETAMSETAACSVNGELDFTMLKTVYGYIAANSDTEITLTDENGAVLVCSEASPCSHTDKNFGGETLSKITADGFYELSTLDNYYEEDYFNIVYPLSINGERYLLFGRLPASSLTEYMKELALTAVLAAAAITAAVFFIMYFYTNSIFSPVREMTMAVRKFGEGDFSAKLNVIEENEFGFLANSINEMATAIAETEETRKSFISNVSHELKTPMTTIGGFIDGILDGTIPPEQQEHYLKIVSMEVNRLSRLVRSMLNISKYEAGELTLSPADIDIIPVIFRTLLSFEKRIDEKRVDVRGLDRGAFYVKADEDLIRQVIYNLTENAVKFVNEGGYIEFLFTENEDGASVTVRNSGEGLKENEISRVFERFYKTDESRGVDPGGVGLGLSIVRSLIKLHGGTILVRSQYEQYVEFEFTLPK